MAEGQHPVKALVEGIVSTVLSVESIAFPIVCGVFTLTYNLAKNGESVCADTTSSSVATSSVTTHKCSSEELATLAIGYRAMFITLLVAAIIILGAAIILGVFAHKNALGAGNVGKAKAGNITGMIGLILGAVLLVLTIVFALVGIAAL
jgi:hypothetical protein